MISNFITKLAQQLAMLAVSLFAVPLASAQTSPAADMQLITDLHHMQVQVNQSAPLPPGGCNSGYTWHTTYGGCRKPQIETETAACAANYTGSRTRSRTGYALQANNSDIRYEQWDKWKENCVSSGPTIEPGPTPSGWQEMYWGGNENDCFFAGIIEACAYGYVGIQWAGTYIYQQQPGYYTNTPQPKSEIPNMIKIGSHCYTKGDFQSYIWDIASTGQTFSISRYKC